MFKTLLKARIQQILSGIYKGKKKNSPLLKAAMAVLFLYAGVCFIAVFGYLFQTLCEPFHLLGIDWLYFALMILTALVLMVVGSIFMTQSQIYQAKDNELLLSMPIPAGRILASRMAVIYLFNLVFELLVFLPAAVVYTQKIQISAAQIAAVIIFAAVLPLLSLALSCVMGWILQLVTSRMKRKSLFTMILSIAFLMLYFYGYSKLAGGLNELAAKGNLVADRLESAVLPLYWAGNAISQVKMEYLLYTLILCILPFAAVYLVLSKTFIKIATTKRGFGASSENVLRSGGFRSSTAEMALLKKEMSHFASSPTYMLNGTLGTVFTVILAIVLIVKKEMVMDYVKVLAAGIPELADQTGALAAAALCAMTTMNIITAPSISLEGKNLWIVQSAPVKTESILWAKLKLHLVVAVPASIFAGLVLSIVLKPDFTSALLIFVLPLVTNIFSAVFGLLINLHFPNFDWISETAAVKQSASAMISMFGSFAAILFPAGLYLAVLRKYIELAAFEWICAAVLAAVTFLLYGCLMKKGTEILKKL